MPRASSPASSSASNPSRKRKDRSPERETSSKRDRRDRDEYRDSRERDRGYDDRDRRSSHRRDDDRRSSRNDRDDRRDRDRDRERERERDRDRGERDHDRRRDRDRDRERDDRRRDDPPRTRVSELKAPDSRPSSARSPESSSQRPSDTAHPASPSRNGASAVAAAAAVSGAAGGGAKETPEEEKQRLVRERLEAWKKKKQQGQAKTDSPAPPAQVGKAVKPVPPPPAPTPTIAPQVAAVKSASTGKGTLPPKPVTGMTFGRLAAAKGLPAKPTFNAFGNDKKGDKGGLGFDDDDTSGNIQKLEFAPMSEADKVVEHPAAQEDEDDELDEMGDEDERAAAARAQAQARSEAITFANGAGAEEVKPQTAKGDQMDVDQPEPERQQERETKPSKEAVAAEKRNEVLKKAAKKGKEKMMEVDQEEADVDPLDAFMSGVVAEVKKVNAEDRAKMKTGKEVVTGEEDESEVDEPEGEDDADELDKTNLRAEDILALAAKKAKKKDVQPVDHSKIEYEPFTKAFYHPAPEIEEMTDDEVKVLRIELDDIKIRGVDCPKPITKWSHCGLPAVCLEVIKRLEYEKPSSIQSQAIPAIMSGRDVIGVAKTGSGKTIAFLLPMFRQIKDQRPLETMEGPIAMIMTPTRELATQIQRDCKPFLKALGLRATCAYGGTPLKDNIADMKRGAEIIVCTPGRMIELLSTNSGRLINLRRVTYLVLDEADRMFDMGFEPQVMKIISQIRPDRQTVLFSATFPKAMESLARKVLKKPLEITVGGKSVVAAEIEQFVEVREESTKFNRLLEHLGRLYNEDAGARTLIFVDRQDSADKLLSELLKKNYTCMSLHGGKDQVDRDMTIQDFKSGIIPVVIATSVAARGLDVKQLKLVINYDCPNHLEDYVHRAGRTGRAGNKGTCITFITPEQDRYAVDLVRALTSSEAAVPEELKTMSEAFIKKVKEGKAKTVGSGFGGKGLDRFEIERDAADRAQRSAYGEPEEKEKDKAAEDGGKDDGSAQAVDLPDLEVEIVRGPAPDPSKKGRLPDRAQPGNLGVPTAAEAIAALGPNATPFEKAQAVQAALNASLNATRRAKAQAAQDQAAAEERARRRDPDATDFHALVPINDYPQKARWRVTNKETMSSLIESTGASITNKGVFYEKGKEPGPDDPPKLALLIESNEEIRIRQAVNEIKRLLLEASTAALEAESRNPGQPAGRYNVL